MTKKDYELIASTIAYLVETLQNSESDAVELSLVSMELARSFACDNSRFDTAKFLKACGVAN